MRPCVLKNSSALWSVTTDMAYPSSLSSHLSNTSSIAMVSNSKTQYACCATVNFLDMKPAGRQVSHCSPCPYTAPMPYIDASQITQMVTPVVGSIGCKIGMRHASAFIASKHFLCSGLHSNACPFRVISANGPIYMETSGMKLARYCTNPRNLCMSP